MSDRQTLRMVCLRRPMWPAGWDDRLGPRENAVLLPAVHPHDVEDLLAQHEGRTILTLSLATINHFAAYDAGDARERLWLADAKGQVRQMSEAEAAIFYRAWEVGIQHVSDVLLTSGIWR